MSWIFEQATGKLTAPDGTVSATGYAGGNCGKTPEGVNNPAMQYVSCTGPLPQGGYTMEAPLQQSHLGPFAIPLMPDATNIMHGRSGFFCHGDNSQGNCSASEGCIIMPHATRTAMWASNDHRIEVVSGE